MADLFISYAREDEKRIGEIVRALEEKHWSIFWDRRVPAGKTWLNYIGQALSDARCVIVAWSRHSITSEWVIEEATDAKDRGVLVPVFLDPVKPPFGFRAIQAADLIEWRPGSSSPHFDQLMQDIARVVGDEPPAAAVEAVGSKEFTNSLGMKFVLIPVGTFLMGRPPGEEGRFKEEKQHEVTISKPSYLQTTPVTQGQWKRIMKNDPSALKECGDDCPVETVSWDDAQAFVSKLNKIEGGEKYRLPTEAEWEYACRAGSNARFCFGDHEEELEEYAWYSDNSAGTTHPVGQKEPNAWDLYDMHGNVWEWVEDDYHDSYEGAPDDGSAWVDKPRGSFRVIRGGSWNDDAHYCRSAMRDNGRPDYRSYYVGFRLSRSVALGS